MTASLVSFVIPAYRPRADWLRASVASALDQRDVEVEVVVVDDGSPEPVDVLLGPLRDRRLQVVRIEHGGVSAARNAGLDHAGGTHVRFLDADDVAEPWSTARLLALALQVDGIGYGATAFCDAALRVIWVMRARQQGDVAIDGMLGRFPVRPPSLVMPRPLLDLIGPWDTSLTVSEDWDYVQRAVEGAPVRGEGAIATFYRRHAQSAASDVAAGMAAASLIVGRCFERRPEWRTPELERRARAMLDARSARVLATTGSWRAAAPHVLQSARLDPRAVGAELRLALPAVAGRITRRVRNDRRPPL